jgi:adenosylcobinamide-phosphate synthase
MISPSIVLLAVLLDALTGDPVKLYKIVPHPVTWLSHSLMMVEGLLNQPDRSNQWLKAAGAATILANILLWVGAAIVIEGVLVAMLSPLWAIVVSAVFGSTLLAARSLILHVTAVRQALEQSGLREARSALSLIVGRDVADLDRSDVARAATESLAENLSDGFVAPLFWYVLLGLPGLVFYKVVNTADSVIGHKSERFLHFGWAAAKLDDGLNLVPARLTALLIAMAAASGRSLQIAVNYASKHPSPNAGWPEASMAGALDVKLGGPRQYKGASSDNAWLGTGREHVSTADLRSAIAIVVRTWFIIFAALLTWLAFDQGFIGAKL